MLDEHPMATMTSGNATIVQLCKRENAPFFPIAILSGVVPFHILVMKILAKNLRFSLPRHGILFSLCLSDGIQVFFTLIVGIIYASSTLPAEGTACQLLRGAFIFCNITTLFVACVAILALSLERYIACIHSFHLHTIVTESRVICGSIGTWGAAVLLSLSMLLASHHRPLEAALEDSIVKICCVILILPTSIAVTLVQVRLYLFSMKKLRQVSPGTVHGVQLELADFRRKHIKIAIVAGTVSFAFVFCMVPFASVCLHELITGASVHAPVKTICGYLVAANTMLDPFIYGMGMADIRKKIFKEIKNMKEHLVDLMLSICHGNPVSS